MEVAAQATRGLADNLKVMDDPDLNKLVVLEGRTTSIRVALYRGNGLQDVPEPR
jgi:hypothetical protein